MPNLFLLRPNALQSLQYLEQFKFYRKYNPTSGNHCPESAYRGLCSRYARWVLAPSQEESIAT